MAKRDKRTKKSEKSKKSKKSRKMRLRNKLDRVFSQYIRRRDMNAFDGYCWYCGTREITQCFHIITRAKFPTRWDENNALGSCGRCNMVNEWNPHPFIAKYIKITSLRKYNNLVRKSNSNRKFETEDYEKMIHKYEQKLETCSFSRGVEMLTKNGFKIQEKNQPIELEWL